MKVASIFAGGYRALVEGLVFLLVAVVLFNTMTEFAAKTSIISGALSITEMQYFGTLSSLLAALNALSDRFFGFSLMR